MSGRGGVMFRNPERWTNAQKLVIAYEQTGYTCGMQGCSDPPKCCVITMSEDNAECYIPCCEPHFEVLTKHLEANLQVRFRRDIRSEDYMEEDQKKPH